MLDDGSSIDIDENEQLNQLGTLNIFSSFVHFFASLLSFYCFVGIICNGNNSQEMRKFSGKMVANLITDQMQTFQLERLL